MAPFDDDPLCLSPSIPRRRALVPLHRVLASLLLCLLLGTDILQGWPLALPTAHAAALPTPTPPTMTLQKFLSQKINDGHQHGSFHYPSTVPPIPGASHVSKPQAPLPSVEPAKMQTVSLGVDSSLLSTSGLSTHGSTASGLRGNPLHVRGSDGRLEVTIAPGSLDLSHATVTSGATPVGPFTVRVSQLHGHLIGSSSILGSYQIQILDHLGRVVHGVQLLQPATIVYHYQPWEMSDLGLDPGHIRLSWPTLL